MASMWPVGKGVLGGRCPECNDQVMLHWKDKHHAEWYCLGCGIVLPTAGRRHVDNRELQGIIRDVFEQLSSKGITNIKLQPFVRVCDTLSQSLYHRPIRSIRLYDLDAMGLEVHCGQVRKKNG